jgi:PIN domain nuclease of toxin-antitoxin system
MKVLLDTHVWLWWLSEPDRLPLPIRQAIEHPASQPLLSVVSSWEIAIKHALGNLPLPESPERFVLKRLKRDGIGSLSIEHRHALATSDLPPHHQDPFDRMLIAQATVEKLPIATVDRKFTAYAVSLVE